MKHPKINNWSLSDLLAHIDNQLLACMKGWVWRRTICLRPRGKRHPRFYWIHLMQVSSDEPLLWTWGILQPFSQPRSWEVPERVDQQRQWNENNEIIGVFTLHFWLRGLRRPTRWTPARACPLDKDHDQIMTPWVVFLDDGENCALSSQGGQFGMDKLRYESIEKLSKSWHFP